MTLPLHQMNDVQTAQTYFTLDFQCQFIYDPNET